MTSASLEIGDKLLIDRGDFDRLLQAILEKDYRIIAPTLRDGAIVYDRIHSSQDFPIGWTDEQEGGFYRLKKRNDQALFGYSVGPHSWKKFLDPPSRRLWKAKRAGGSFQMEEEKMT